MCVYVSLSAASDRLISLFWNNGSKQLSGIISTPVNTEWWRTGSGDFLNIFLVGVATDVILIICGYSATLD